MRLHSSQIKIAWLLKFQAGRSCTGPQAFFRVPDASLDGILWMSVGSFGGFRWVHEGVSAGFPRGFPRGFPWGFRGFLRVSAGFPPEIQYFQILEILHTSTKRASFLAFLHHGPLRPSSAGGFPFATESKYYNIRRRDEAIFAVRLGSTGAHRTMHRVF